MTRERRYHLRVQGLRYRERQLRRRLGSGTAGRRRNIRGMVICHAHCQYVRSTRPRSFGPVRSRWSV